MNCELLVRYHYSSITLKTLLVFSVVFFSCTQATKKPTDFKPYDGPVMQMNDVNTLFSDSAKVKVQMLAPLQNEFLNGDREFPNGFVLYFYDAKGDTNSTMTANHGKLVKLTGIYTATGNVIIRNTKEGKRMNTELLNWNPGTQKVYTEKFVRIQTKTEILTGNGLDANQDFKYYKIRNPEGVFSVNQ